MSTDEAFKERCFLLREESTKLYSNRSPLDVEVQTDPYSDVI